MNDHMLKDHGLPSNIHHMFRVVVDHPARSAPSYTPTPISNRILYSPSMPEFYDVSSSSLSNYTDYAQLTFPDLDLYKSPTSDHAVTNPQDNLEEMLSDNNQVFNALSNYLVTSIPRPSITSVTQVPSETTDFDTNLTHTDTPHSHIISIPATSHTVSTPHSQIISIPTMPHTVSAPNSQIISIPATSHTVNTPRSQIISIPATLRCTN